MTFLRPCPRETCRCRLHPVSVWEHRGAAQGDWPMTRRHVRESRRDQSESMPNGGIAARPTLAQRSEKLPVSAVELQIVDHVVGDPGHDVEANSLFVEEADLRVSVAIPVRLIVERLGRPLNGL